MDFILHEGLASSVLELLAGSSKMAQRISIFSITIGADYSFGVNNIEIRTPTFFKHNNSFIASVLNVL